MTTDLKKIQQRKQARIAGFWYLIMGVAGGFGIMYVPLNILVQGDAAASAANIVAADWVYSLSMLSNLIGQVAFIFLVLDLNRLLKEVNPKSAKLMVTLVTAAVPIAFLNTLTLIGAQLLANKQAMFAGFEPAQINDLVLLFLKLYEHGVIIIQIFWGLWLLPFGLLVIKSGFIPKWIGVLLVVGCFTYLIDSTIGFMLPQYKEMAAGILMLPLAAGEFSIIFWLLVKGVRE
ncbi:MAG: DUF4386 domain-containing protein [Cyclobacteriaceae bacterium]